MKQKDIMPIIVVAFVAAVISIVLSRMIFKTPRANQMSTNVPSISASFPKPDPTYFNSQSINPTQLITINNYHNTNPF